MRNDLPLTVIGNLVDDPELRFTPAGVPVARFTVASTPRSFDRESNTWHGGWIASRSAGPSGPWVALRAPGLSALRALTGVVAPSGPLEGWSGAPSGTCLHGG